MRPRLAAPATLAAATFLLTASGCGPSASASPPTPMTRANTAPTTSRPDTQPARAPASPRASAPGPSAQPGSPHPHALVLLLDRPGNFSEQAAKSLVKAHWGDAAIFAESMGNDELLRGYIFNHPGGFIAVNVCKRTYVPPQQLQAAADSIADERMRDAFFRHKGWISVDFISMPTEKPVAFNKPLARMAADLLDSSCLLLYSTDRDAHALPSHATPERLRASDDPLDLFPDAFRRGESAFFDNAVAEARRRLPEFCAAWQRGKQTKADGLFLVKIAFLHDRGREHMWVRVEEMDGDTVRGELGNQPVNVPNLRQGQRVTVNLADASDWLYGLSRTDCDGAFTDPRMRAMIGK